MEFKKEEHLYHDNKVNCSDVCVLTENILGPLYSLIE